MYVGVKLINYPHLYYFSHFTHFTLYLRKCEKYQILFNFVLISKWRLLHSFQGIWKNISFCLEVLKGCHSWQETLEIIPVSLKLQLLITTPQFTCNTVLWKYSRISTNLLSGDYKFTKFTKHMNSHNCISYMDLWNILNCQLPSKHCATTSPTILNFYLNTFSTLIPMKCGRRNMIRVLNYFLECVKLLSVLFHLNIHRPV